MNKFFSVLISLLCLSVNIYCQNKYSVTGTVIDGASNEPLEFASIQILSDSTLVSGNISDNKGFFEINNLKNGNYVIQVSFVGYINVSKKIKVDGKNLNVGKIIMSIDSKMLDGVVVVGQASPMTMRNDTIEFNSEAFRVSDGAALEELIKKLPGAEISQDGKLTINGKEVKKVLVNGKEFFSDDPKISLKNLPANMVAKVKSYDKKSENAIATGIDDDDDETVIDLTVKKGMKKGWLGNLLAGLGNKERYEAAAMLSRFTDDSNLSFIGSLNNTNNIGFSEFGDADFGRQTSAGSGVTSSKMGGITLAKNYKKSEVGGNVRYGYSDNDAKKTSFTETLLDEGSNFKNDTAISRRKRNDLNVNLRFKWTPDTFSTITFLPNITYSKTNSEGVNSSNSLNSNQFFLNRKKSESLSEGDNFGLSSSLRYTKKFKKKGRRFSAVGKFNFANNDYDIFSNSFTYFFDEEDDDNLPDSTLRTDRYTDKESVSRTLGIELSYSEPIFKNHILQLKYGFQYRSSESESFVYDKLSGANVFIDSLSSKVKNTYNNHNAEIGIQGSYASTTYNLGFSLQPQYSISKTSVGPNIGKDLSQSVINFAPNVRLKYKFSKQSSINFNYRGQSSAPNIEYLQDVIDQDDPLNLKFGNPNLKPSFTNNVRLRYVNYNSERQRNIIAYITYKNVLNSVTNKTIYNTTTGGKETYKININGNWNLSVNLTYSTPLKNRKFNISNIANASYSENPSFYSQRKSNLQVVESKESKTKSFSLKDKLSGSYRCDDFDISLFVSLGYLNSYNKLQNSKDRETFDYDFGANSNINLPWNLILSTDLNYNLYSGYSDGYNEKELIWNAQISKNFLKNNAATIRVKFYDILQQESNLTRTVSDIEICDTRYNTLGSFFMVHFVYRINTLGMAAKKGFSKDGDYRKKRKNREGDELPKRY